MRADRLIDATGDTRVDYRVVAGRDGKARGSCCKRLIVAVDPAVLRSQDLVDAAPGGEGQVLIVSAIECIVRVKGRLESGEAGIEHGPGVAPERALPRTCALKASAGKRAGGIGLFRIGHVAVACNLVEVGESSVAAESLFPFNGIGWVWRSVVDEDKAAVVLGASHGSWVAGEINAQIATCELGDH